MYLNYGTAYTRSYAVTPWFTAINEHLVHFSLLFQMFHKVGIKEGDVCQPTYIYPEEVKILIRSVFSQNICDYPDPCHGQVSVSSYCSWETNYFCSGVMSVMYTFRLDDQWARNSSTWENNLNLFISESEMRRWMSVWAESGCVTCSLA